MRAVALLKGFVDIMHNSLYFSVFHFEKEKKLKVVIVCSSLYFT